MDDHEKFAAILREAANDPVKIRNIAGQIDSDCPSLPCWMRRGFKLRGLTAAEQAAVPEHRAIRDLREQLYDYRTTQALLHEKRRQLEIILEREKKTVMVLLEKCKVLENENKLLAGQVELIGGRNKAYRKTWNRLGSFERIRSVVTIESALAQSDLDTPCSVITDKETISYIDTVFEIAAANEDSIFEVYAKLKPRGYQNQPDKQWSKAK